MATTRKAPAVKSAPAAKAKRAPVPVEPEAPKGPSLVGVLNRAWGGERVAVTRSEYEQIASEAAGDLLIELQHARRDNDVYVEDR